MSDDGDEALWGDWGEGDVNVTVESQGPDAVDVGVLFGLGAYFLDRQADRIVDGLSQPQEVIQTPVEEEHATINAASDLDDHLTWDDFVGQENLKRQLRVHIESAQARGVALEHTLLASGRPGVGKTTMARIIAQEMGGGFFMLVPPFHRTALNEAAMTCEDGDILFIDEIHKLADHGKSQAENLLHIMEDKALYLPMGKIYLSDFTLIGATTDADKLPETIIDRFTVKPHFEEYSEQELIDICYRFEKDYEIFIPLDLRIAIARASRKTPRVIRELTIAVRDLIVPEIKRQGLEDEPPIKILQHHRELFPSPKELLEFKSMTPEGLTPVHREYITGIYRAFGRTTADGERVYVAGEMSLVTMMRMPKQGLARVERELIETGLIDRTPQGRKLTPRGIKMAQRWA